MFRMIVFSSPPRFIIDRIMVYSAMMIILFFCSLAEAQYNVSNYFEGYEIYDIEQHDGQLYFGMRENEESPTSIVRYDPDSRTYFTYPDFAFDENTETGYYKRIDIEINVEGTIWAGGYKVGFFDGRSWIDRTPAHPYYHECSWIELSNDNEIYIHYYTWGGWDDERKYSNCINIYRDNEWIDFLNNENTLDIYNTIILNLSFFCSDGGLWAGTAQGYPNVFCYNNGEWMEHERPFFQVPHGFIEASNGHIWTLGAFSLAEYDGNEWYLYENDDLIQYQYPLDFSIGPDNVVWMGCNGCLATFDGSSWTLMTEGYHLPSYVIRSITIDDEGVIYIGTTNGLSVWTPETVSVQSGKPYENSVSVFPNPANPVSNVSYSIAVPSHVTIDIYSINGQKVDTLVDEYRDAGIHTSTFDGSNLASGLYFYRLQSEAFTTTGKLMLLK